MRLSVLDQSPIPVGGTAREALLATIELAKACDRLGYERYWLAEHHNSPALASASPEVLIPAVAGATSRIRVGSGGVMLSHYSPLKVAENFRALEALFPGRIDLGLGRAPGSDGRTAQALQHGPGALPIDAYPEQVQELVEFLADRIPEGHPFHGIHAAPVGPGMPQPWLLASSWDSAGFAARLGLPLSFAHFISPDGGPQVVRDYRERFEPSQWLGEPLVNIGVSALCADTDEDAHRIGMSRHLMRLRREQGRAGGVPSVQDALDADYTEPERDYIRYQQSLALEGAPERVRAGLVELAEQYEVDELVVVTITHDYADRVRSYELLAEAFDLGG